MLKIESVSKSFRNGETYHRALDQVSLYAQEGEWVSIIGSNGAGKSTLLQSISGEIWVDSGSIRLGPDLNEISKLPAHLRSASIGRVFQDPTQGTVSGFSIEENLALALLRGTSRIGISSFFKPVLNGNDRARIKAALSAFKIGIEGQPKKLANHLSGGQRQALTLLMATICPPQVLLLDEHCAALDPKSAELIMDFTAQVIRKNRVTTLMITHNMKHALQFSDRLIMMDQGKIIVNLEKNKIKLTTVEDLFQLFRIQSDRMFLARSSS